MNGVAQATTTFPLNDYKSCLANPCACPGTFHNSCSVKSQGALLEYSRPHPPFHTLPLVTKLPVVCGVLWNSQGSLSCFSSTCDFIPYHAPHSGHESHTSQESLLTVPEIPPPVYLELLLHQTLLTHISWLTSSLIQIFAYVSLLERFSMALHSKTAPLATLSLL